MDNLTNLQTVQLLFQCYSKGDVAAFMAMLSPEISWTEPGDPADIPYSGTFTGLAGVSQLLGILSRTVKMKTFSADTFCVNDDIETVTVLGSNTAEVVATGKTYSTDWVYAIKLSGGKIMSIRVYMDTLIMAKAFKEV